ncbi:GLUG motif-containing protein [Desulfitobacterium metallireducens]|uniref:GLUG domain-containing protein n=1 Tax=Desulfitobacterium metallireducens DSM 15288 TaxID=871968 RepID=W0ECE9_9FIRM|nr:GLUG motif-containing protein [Desulfitobacterium metallireducens]AHF08560.1 hypothetical protein DESME_08870 [Desulfitobacterium metallireducens DSM 15288]
MLGSGTSLDPYQITTLSELDTVRNNLTAYYKLMNDIDASDTINWNSGAGWVPISGFAKEFNGNFHVIDGLYANRPSEQRVGLFDEFFSSTNKVMNLGLSNVNFRGGIDYIGVSSVGGIVGEMVAGSITKCFVTGTIVGNISADGYTGGIAGSVRYTAGCTISDCYSKCNITGRSAGGIAGFSMYNI